MGLTTQIVQGARASRLLVLLHGVGANERDLVGLAPLIDPDGNFMAVVPRGQYSQPPGYAWYSFSNPPAIGSNLKTSVQSIDETVDEVLEKYAMTLDGSVVAGFSQGGSVALALAFGVGREKRRPKAALVMSGFLLPEIFVDYDFADPAPVLFQHGTQDQIISPDDARASAIVLREHGVAVSYIEYEMAHQVTDESIADAALFLEKVEAGQSPTNEIPEPSEEYKVKVREAIDRATEGHADDAPSPAHDPAASAPDDNAVVRSVSAATFQAEVLDSEVPVIVDFWAPWCQPCLQVSPIVESIALMRKASYKVVKINIDENQALAQQYGVQSIPLIALFRNGRLERQSLGVKPRPQLEAELGMLVIP